LNKDEISTKVRERIKGRVQVIQQKLLDVLLSAHTVSSVSPSAGAGDPFCDPVRATYYDCVPKLIEWVVDGEDTEEVKESLMSIIRIRSVQTYTPSETISFVLALRWIFRDTVYTALDEDDREGLFLLFESRIDGLLLMALDCYVQCHDKIGQIRVNEAKAERDRLMKLVKFMGRGKRE
jgi:hypothetical protein